MMSHKVDWRAVNDKQKLNKAYRLYQARSITCKHHCLKKSEVGINCQSYWCKELDAPCKFSTCQHLHDLIDNIDIRANE